MRTLALLAALGTLAASAAAQPARLLKDIAPGRDARLGAEPSGIAAAGEVAYATGVGGLWKTDGTPEGTVLVRELLTPGASVYVAAGTVFFTAAEPQTGGELWRSDGTAAGTVRITDLAPGTQNGVAVAGSPLPALVLDGVLLFAGTDGRAGTELWRSDGTAAGTTLVKEIAPGPSSSAPSDFVRLGRHALFLATDGVRGRELWRTDGTPEGTALVKDLVPGASSEPIRDLTLFGSAVYFATVTGSAPWRSDGTEAGTSAFATHVVAAPGSSPPGPRSSSAGATPTGPARAGSGRPTARPPARSS